MATYKSTSLGQLRLQINALQQKVRRREDKIVASKAGIKKLDETSRSLNASETSKLNRLRFELRQAQEDLTHLKTEVEDLVEVRTAKKLETGDKKTPADEDEVDEGDVPHHTAPQQQEVGGEDGVVAVQQVTDNYLEELGLNAEQVDNQELTFNNY